MTVLPRACWKAAGNTNRDVTIRGNHIDGSNQNGTPGSTYLHGIFFQPVTRIAGHTHKHVQIDGNLLANLCLAAVRFESTDTSDPSDDLVVTNNICRSVTRGLDLLSCDAKNVTFTDNQLPDITVAASALMGTTKVLSALINVRNAVNGLAGGIIGSGTAAPTGKTWRQGDVVLNSAPASAGYVGWVCTVAGAPGTWKTFGLIS